MLKILYFIIACILVFCVGALGAHIIEKYGAKSKIANTIGKILAYSPFVALVLFFVWNFIGAFGKGIEPDEDGFYCAKVTYYNPETGTQTDFESNVLIEDQKLISINFNNGGQLDTSHFEPEDISEGNATITSDKGYEYTVVLKHDNKCD